MVAKNSQGQAFLEMTLSLMLFVGIWLFVQSSIKKHKKDFHKWEIGRETQSRFQKNDSRRKN